MTNREFYNAIANMETVADDVRNHALAAIAKIDATNEKRKTAPKKETKAQAERRAADEVLKPQVVEFIGTNKDVVASTIADALNKTPQKISRLCAELVEAGYLVEGTTKVDGKKRVCYSKA